MIALCAMPVLAKPMASVTNPILDDGFMLDELSEEQMQYIYGNANIHYASTGPDPLITPYYSSHGKQPIDQDTDYQDPNVGHPINPPNQSAGGGYFNDASQNPGGVLRCK